MSSSASGQGFHPPTDWEDFTDAKNDKPPPYAQEPLFEGSYVDDEGALISRPADCSDSIEGGFTNHTYQNPTQNLQYPQRPQNPAYPQQLQQDPQSSQYSAPYQPDYGAYDPPPKYTGLQDDANAKLGYNTYAPQGMQGIGQQPGYPAPTAHDRRSFVTYPPPATGQYVVTQPQGFGGQPPVIIVRPILEDPPQDYLGYSIFVTFCCCWIIGFIAIAKSIECRRQGLKCAWTVMDGVQALIFKAGRRPVTYLAAQPGRRPCSVDRCNSVISLRHFQQHLFF